MSTLNGLPEPELSAPDEHEFWAIDEPSENDSSIMGDSSEGEAEDEVNPSVEYATETIPSELFEQMLTDRKVRAAVCGESHYAFFHFYLAHAVDYDTAPFHKEIFHLTEDESVRKIFICAFRDPARAPFSGPRSPSGRSSASRRRNSSLILCDTRYQAKMHMDNLKMEFEGNRSSRTIWGHSRRMPTNTARTPLFSITSEPAFSWDQWNQTFGV